MGYLLDVGDIIKFKTNVLPSVKGGSVVYTYIQKSTKFQSKGFKK